MTGAKRLKIIFTAMDNQGRQHAFITYKVSREKPLCIPFIEGPIESDTNDLLLEMLIKMSKIILGLVVEAGNNLICHTNGLNLLYEFKSKLPPEVLYQFLITNREALVSEIIWNDIKDHSEFFTDIEDWHNLSYVMNLKSL